MVIYTIQSKVYQYSNYTPLNTTHHQVLLLIKDNPSLEWPKRMKGDPSKRNKSKYYHFHRDHGHDTDECYDLKQQIEALIIGKVKKNSWARPQGRETANEG